MDLEVVVNFSDPLTDQQMTIVIAITEVSGGTVGGGGTELVYAGTSPIGLARFVYGLSILSTEHVLPIYYLTEVVIDDEEIEITPVETIDENTQLA